MKLTNPVKKQLALDMVAAAVEKNAKPMIQTIKKLEKQWRDVYVAHFISTLPEVPQGRWAGLLQEGVLKSVSGMGIMQLTQYKEVKDSPSYSNSSSIKLLESYTGKRTDWLQELAARIRPLFDTTELFSVYGRQTYLELTFHPQRKKYDLPAASAVEFLDLRYGENRKDPNFDRTEAGQSWYNLASPLLDPTMDLARLFMKVFVEAEKQYDALTTALAAVSTRAQLLELLPEAEQFLPAPPPKPSKIVPAKLFSDARKMLETGIPT